MEDDLSLHLQSVWQSPNIGFYCLKAAASAELVEIFLLGLHGWGRAENLVYYAFLYYQVR